MVEANRDYASDELKGLSALYSLLCYAMRELASLEAACEDAEDAIAAAQAAIRARMSAVQAKTGHAEVTDDPEIPLH